MIQAFRALRDVERAGIKAGDLCHGQIFYLPETTNGEWTVGGEFRILVFSLVKKEWFSEEVDSFKPFM